MSREQQGGMRQPPLATQPPPGQNFVPERLTHIPQQESNLQYCQPYIHPQQQQDHSNSSPLLTGGGSRLSGSFPPSLPPPPPPPLNHHNLSVPPPHYHGHPPPMFSSIPPSVPPRFSQPPPAMPHTPSIPYQGVLQAPSMPAPMESNIKWHQHNLPPVPQYSQSLGPALNTIVSNNGSADMGQEEEEEDLQWLKEFEKRVTSCPPSPSSPLTESTTATTTTTNTRMDIKLAEVQRLMQESHSLMEQLCGIEKKLAQVSSTNEEEWDQLMMQAEAVKLNLNQTLKNFQDEKFVQRTKTLIKQRQAKRKRVRQRKKQVTLEKEQVKREREEKEAKIDAWRVKLQREEDSKRREEAVKQEADSILGEVRQKQSEAQRMLQLMEALAVLRQARATQAAAQGQPKDTQAEERFTTTTGLITDAVKEQLKEYKLEEQTLRVMMEESASQRSAALSVKGDAAFARFQDSVRKLLFGPAATHEEDDFSLEMLVQRRQEWDQFVVEGDSLLASAVPLSWVLPPAQPDSQWATFLKR